MDIFNMFFGGGGRMQRERKGKTNICRCKRLFVCGPNIFLIGSGFAVGKNVVHQLSVSLEEMYKGSTRRLGLQKNVICEKCEGMFVFVLSSPLKNVSRVC